MVEQQKNRAATTFCRLCCCPPHIRPCSCRQDTMKQAPCVRGVAQFSPATRKFSCYRYRPICIRTFLNHTCSDLLWGSFQLLAAVHSSSHQQGMLVSTGALLLCSCHHSHLLVLVPWAPDSQKTGVAFLCATAYTHYKHSNSITERSLDSEGSMASPVAARQLKMSRHCVLWPLHPSTWWTFQEPIPWQLPTHLLLTSYSPSSTIMEHKTVKLHVFTTPL